MIGAMLQGALLRKKRRPLLAMASIALGAAVVAGLAGVALGVGDQVEAELRRYGANLEVVPKDQALPLAIRGVDVRPPVAGSAASLREADLPALKTFFWRHNVRAFAPWLEAQAHVNVTEAPGAWTGREVPVLGTWFDHGVPVPSGSKPFATGAPAVNPAWRVTGRWPADRSADAPEPEVLVGASLAERLGAPAHAVLPALPGRLLAFRVNGHLVQGRVAGTLRTGGPEDDAVIVPLALAQRLTGRTGQVDRVSVAALTTPETSGPAAKAPSAMSPQEAERWACTAYPSSVAAAITRALPGSEARVVRRVADTEGQVLSRITLLMALVALAAVAAAVLGVMSAMTTSVLERRSEIGLLRALGASDGALTGLFLAEALVLALVGGSAGYGGGWLLARQVGLTLFGDPLTPPILILPATLVVAAGVALAGSAWPVRQALRIQPTEALRG